MAITVAWDNSEQTRLRLSFMGNWNWDELHRAIDIAEAMAAARATLVDALVDLTDAATMPSGSLLDPAFRANAQMLARRATGQHGRIVIVGASAWMVSTFNAFRGLLGERMGRIAFSSSVEEAERWLEQASIPTPIQPTPAEAA